MPDPLRVTESPPPDRGEAADAPAASTAPTAELTLLGGARLSGPAALGAQPLAMGKPLAVLAFLACAPGRAATRDQLIDLLWADVERDAARHTLRQTVWYIKRRLGLDPFTARGDTLSLVSWVATDRDAFLTALDGARYADAVTAYTGEFFRGFAAPGGAEFEQWADLERSRLQSLFVRAADAHARELLTAGRTRDAVQIARRARDLAPSTQATWRLLLEMLLAADDRISALVEVEQLEQWLTREDLAPDKATVTTVRLVRTESGRDRQQEPEGLVAELIGREREFTVLLKAWDDAQRGVAMHVHLWARPGFGKTRLLQGFSRRLRAARARLVSVRALQANRDIPCALVAELTLALARLRGAAGVSPESASALVALAPGVSAYLNAPPDRATGDDALRRRTLALQELITTIADDAPIAILIDDLHWADPGSRSMLASVAAGLGTQHVLLVTTSRQAERMPTERAREMQLPLSPLIDDQVGALVESLGELPTADWAASFATRLTETTGGSPLLILETLQLAIERGALRLADRQWSCTDVDALSQTLGHGSAIRERVLAVGDAQGATLLLLAVLGSDIGAMEAQRVGGEEGAASLLELEARGLLSHREGRWTIAHDEIGDLVRELATAPRLARAHREAASLLEAHEPASPFTTLRAASHRFAAGDRPAAVQLLARAARLTDAVGDRSALAALAQSVIGAEGSPAERDALVRALPWRTRASASRLLARTGSLLLVVALVSAAFWQRPQALARAPDAVATLPIVVDGKTRVLRVTLDAATMRQVDAIEAKEERLSPQAMRLLREFNTWYARIGDTLLVSSTRHGAQQGAELEALSLASGQARRLTEAIGDDNSPSFSPDLSRAVFSTGRWDTVTSRPDLALLDRRSGDVTPLVRSLELEASGVWSEDGTRIAFMRRHYTSERPAEVCWVTVDGAIADCLTPSGLDAAIPLGWYDTDEVIVEGEDATGSDRVLARLHLRTGAMRFLHRGANGYRVSPDGRFALVSTLAPDRRTGAVIAFETDRPQHKVPVRWDGRDLEVPAVLLAWDVTARTSATLATVRIDAPTEPVPLDALAQLSAVGVDARGVARTPAVLRWHSLDTVVATITPGGRLIPRRPGEARIVLSAGGWRADTVAVQIVPRAFETPVLAESWASLDTTRWLDYGDPVPEVRSGELLPNGDGHLPSGVISWIATDPREGVGVELRARIPVNDPQWQALAVYLTPFAPDEALRRWAGRRSGTEMVEYRAAAIPRQCGFRFPRGEGGDAMRHGLLVSAANDEPLKDSSAVVTDGAWHTLRLQLFRDGRCGLAIDGRVIRVSRHSIPLDRPMRIVISGQSVGTMVRVGALQLWRGERLEIPWFAGDSLAW
jgi:DNA-binding SARP family transcriptional activator